MLVGVLVPGVMMEGVVVVDDDGVVVVPGVVGVKVVPPPLALEG